MSNSDWQQAIDEEREYLNNNPGNGYFEEESAEVTGLRAEAAKLRQACEGLLEHAIDGGRKAAFAVLHNTLAEDGACVCSLCAENNAAIESIRFAREALARGRQAEGKDQA